MAIMKTGRPVVRGRAFGFPGFAALPGFEDLEKRMTKAFEGNAFMPFERDLFAQPIGFLPATDIIESDDMLELAVELPGLEKKDVEISVEEGVLTLRGEKLEERKENEDNKYHLFERIYGSFQRTFVLPRSVDPTKITAEFANGVLKVFLPKTTEAKAKGRKIEIAVK